ncbi:hypothetical protein DL89DRAFT_255517 [Linderina pennispora]|uniref:Uncharacterized protein n=1 Tax=Linderina pennispora TaxID=61395 RepID=A0A1Y1WE28_9FUNG|nr:uncharacterized protein DL89DRAFT_255517 [Linderina pennispora]ORX71781.1 hypothetical protein DL89DRAFT_255517 [Linderina pennispora]
MRFISFATVCAIGMSPILAAPALSSFLAMPGVGGNPAIPVTPADSVTPDVTRYFSTTPPKYWTSGNQLSSTSTTTVSEPGTTTSKETSTSAGASGTTSKTTTHTNTYSSASQPTDPGASNLYTATTPTSTTTEHQKPTKCLTQDHPSLVYPTDHQH